MTIVAGHQRTRALTVLGVDTVDAIFVNDVTHGEEIKFNQIHNGTERADNVRLSGDGYSEQQYMAIESAAFEVSSKTVIAVAEICKLLIKHGNALSCCVCAGKVYVGQSYVAACKQLSWPVNTYIIPAGLQDECKRYLTDQYGQYSYSHLEKHTYVQGLAQMHRMTEKREGKRQSKSHLYESMVLPYLTGKDASVLDFGCGRAAYINMLSKMCPAVGLEFYPHNGKAVDVAAGNRMVDKLIRHIDQRGAFDVVVCDSVLNSVDSKEAELSVIRCLSLFSRGKVFISGRPMEATKRLDGSSRQADVGCSYITYLDADGFTGSYREGQWYYQMYHDKEKIIALLRENGLEPVNVRWGTSCTSWQIECNKVRNLSDQQYIDAVRFEFNLPLPHGRRYGRDEDMLAALRRAGMIMG
jgi:ParB family chromosome partitioning protein